ncbi:MAG: histidinol-phosphate transaminase [Nitrospirota bacterium]
MKQLGLGIAASSILLPERAAVSNQLASATQRPPEHAGPIRLDRNENAYGPSTKAIAAMQQAASRARRYPDAAALQNELALRHNVKPEQIVLGAGSADILRMAASAFLNTRNSLILGNPTCDLLVGNAKSMGAGVVEVPLRNDHAHDLHAMWQRSAGSGASGLIYICNPNSPTSTLSPRAEIEEFLGKVSPDFHVVIDEAYHDYAVRSGSYRSFLERPVANPHVIVTRTFSAAHGLAGARVGYAVTSAPVARTLSSFASPFAVSGTGVAAALAELADQHHVDTCAKRNVDDRQEFKNQVNARMLRVLDSHTNFSCLNVMRPATEIFEHYRKNNFVLAPPIPSMPNYLRISLGTPEEMLEFWRVWDLLGSHPMSM